MCGFNYPIPNAEKVLGGQMHIIIDEEDLKIGEKRTIVQEATE